jgi:cell division protein FtsI/penicillin-binding protein 2
MNRILPFSGRHSSSAADGTRRITRRDLIFAAMVSFRIQSHPAAPSTSRAWQDALDNTLRNTSASAVIVSQESGRILGAHGNIANAHSPGSLLKPFFLFAALEKNLISPQTTVFCRRNLRIDDRLYPCTHPQSDIAFDAREALAYSCNTWFASLALRFEASELERTLHSFGLHTDAPLSSPANKQLLLLGLKGVITTPLEMASSYRILANRLNLNFAKPVADGLHDSVSFGMAHHANVVGVNILGKTGTANELNEAWSHGWFTGFATVQSTPVAVVFFLPQGNGADASALAQRFFLKINEATR